MAGLVLTEIVEWAADLPYWEQATLDRILTKGSLNDNDYDEILQYLLEDAQLAITNTPRLSIVFTQLANQPPIPSGPPRRLSKLANLQNINALVPNQVLTFGPAMTAIFGANGSGKSGYARVLASAAFTRGDRDVLHDVTRPHTEGEMMSVEIELLEANSPRIITHTIGTTLPELRSFYVFDSTSVRAHLTKSNEMSFSPAGLDALTRFALATDEIRKDLEKAVANRTRLNSFTPLFAGTTVVSSHIAQLGANTDLAQLRALADLSESETIRLAALEQRIAEIKSMKLLEQIAEKQQAVQDLGKLKSQLQDWGEAVGVTAYNRVSAHIGTWQTKKDIAQIAGISQFQEAYFQKIGSPEWMDFLVAAHRLGQAELPDYPQHDSRCLLCHQPLSSEAYDLIRRLWNFLESAAQDELEEAEQVLAQEQTSLKAINFATWSDQSVAYRQLSERNPDTVTSTGAYVMACRQRQEALVTSVEHRAMEGVSELPPSPLNSIDEIIEQIIAERKTLESTDTLAEISKLEIEKQELDHRRLLANQLSLIESYVMDCQWVKQASSAKVKRSTAHITRMHNELFRKVITEAYLKIFEENLKRLNCPLRVKIETKAQKGSNFRQIVLKKDPTAQTADPQKVLSEGEQRAIAIADFLTEVALDPHSAGIILDDPVTSLDFDWKEKIAIHLAEVAKERQVIVFTHDLHFLYCLKINAEKQSIDIASHWVQVQDEKPGHVFINNSPALERDYRKPTKAKDFLERAKKSTAEEQQMWLTNGFGALRTNYEAFIILELFNEVVQRFHEPISFGRLKDVLVDKEVVDEIIERYETLSRYIEGHSHSDQFAAQKPTPSELESEINALENLRKKLRDKKKAAGLSV